MDELKECPFCGTKAVSSVFSIDVFNWYEEKVVCDECRCRINHPKAVAIWNTRPAEDALKAEVERLKAMIAVIQDSTDETAVEDMRKLREVAE